MEDGSESARRVADAVISQLDQGRQLSDRSLDEPGLSARSSGSGVLRRLVGQVDDLLPSGSQSAREVVVQTLRGFGEGGELGLSPVGAQRAELQHLLDEISASQEGSQSARDLVAQTVREFSEGKPLSARSPSEERAVVMMQSAARGWMANEQAELLRLRRQDEALFAEEQEKFEDGIEFMESLESQRSQQDAEVIARGVKFRMEAAASCAQRWWRASKRRKAARIKIQKWWRRLYGRKINAAVQIQAAVRRWLVLWSEGVFASDQRIFENERSPSPLTKAERKMQAKLESHHELGVTQVDAEKLIQAGADLRAPSADQLIEIGAQGKQQKRSPIPRKAPSRDVMTPSQEKPYDEGQFERARESASQHEGTASDAHESARLVAEEQSKLAVERAKLDAERVRLESEEQSKLALERAKLDAERVRLESEEQSKLAFERAKLDAERVRLESDRLRMEAEEKTRMDAERWPRARGQD